MSGNEATYYGMWQPYQLFMSENEATVPLFASNYSRISGQISWQPYSLFMPVNETTNNVVLLNESC